VLGILLVVLLIQLGPLMLAALAARAAPLVDALASGAATALVLPFSVTAQTLLYYDLLARRQTDASAA
jgi:hypothetical protein